MPAFVEAMEAHKLHAGSNSVTMVTVMTVRTGSARPSVLSSGLSLKLPLLTCPNNPTMAAKKQQRRRVDGFNHPRLNVRARVKDAITK